MYSRNWKGRALVAAALVDSGAVFAANIPSAPTSDLGVTPYIIPGANPGGNRNCAEAGVAFWSDALHYQCYSAKCDYPDEFDGGFDDINGNPTALSTIGGFCWNPAPFDPPGVTSPANRGNRPR